MRKFTCFLLIACAVVGHGMLAGAAETWRWKDANGVTHYSDVPVPGAERVSLIAPKPSSSPQPAPREDPAAARPGSETRAAPIVPYSRCVIVAPDNEETFNAVTAVNVGVYVEPKLQEGHRIQVQLDGNVLPDWPSDAFNYQVKELLRGAHTISARVLDADGGTACTGPPATFHIRLPTVPQARPQPRG